VDIYDQPIESFFRHYYALINGSDTNFSQPFVLTYPQTSYPTDKPRPQLRVYNLSGYTRGFPPIVVYASVDDDQIWGADRPSLLGTRREAVARIVRARTAPPGEREAARRSGSEGRLSKASAVGVVNAVAGGAAPPRDTPGIPPDGRRNVGGVCWNRL
jgi:hypothetical protein